LRTIANAVRASSPGGTIVLREGAYHETVAIPDGKPLTVQSYPGEEVWLDGSTAVTGWRSQGQVWVKDGWTAQFDRSPTYTWGAADYAEANWTFINPAYPTAAWPDQVWINGEPLYQVSTIGEVRAGTFAVDYANNRLYVGSNPTGATVRASDLAQAITVRSAGSVLRGFGIRNFAPSVPHMAGVTLERPGIVAENLIISDFATTGLSAIAGNITVRNVTIQRSGMLGMHASTADNLLLDAVRVVGNNTEHFNQAPVAGGFKTAKSRHLIIRDSYFADNLAAGIWLDQSIYDSVLVSNDVVGNDWHGMFIEISAKTVVADNLIVDNGGDGIMVNNTSDAVVWNNTLVSNGRHVDLVQDSRRASDLSIPGHDPRQPMPDPTMTWLLGPASVGNNVMSGIQSGAVCLLCVEDYSHERSAAQMGVTADGNVYNRLAGGQPPWMVVWSRGAGDPAVYTTVSAFTAATGQEAHGLAVEGTPVANSDGVLTPALVAAESSVARPVPAVVAEAVNRPAGASHLGAWFD
jgi:trimeric autotransporter adhesin